MKIINNNLTITNFADYNSTSRIKYIVIHYTANNGDTAWANTNYFKTEYRGASAHYFVDENAIWRSVLDEDVAWHCGTTGTYYHSSCRNTNSIGIEMCSRISGGRYYFMDETVDNTIELVKDLMAKYNIPIENVVRHYDVTYKTCPDPYVKDTGAWAEFKSRLITEEEINMEELNQIKELVWDLTAKYERLETKHGELVVRFDDLASIVDKIVALVFAEWGWIDDNMPEWARPHIQDLVDAELLKGDENGNLQLSRVDLKHYVFGNRLKEYILNKLSESQGNIEESA